MNNDIKLTVIIPCYNFEKYVQTCINSILNQKINFNYEILIHDDKSTDNTFEIIKENYSFEEKIKITQSEKNCGITLNLKKLFDIANGDYIFTLDGDDYLTDENYLQRAVDFLESNKSYSLYCSGYKTLYPDGKMIPEQENLFLTPIKNEVTKHDLLEINYISFARVFRNYKNLIKNWMNDSIHEDWALNSEILKHGPAKCETDAFAGVYRITNHGRITSLTNHEKHEKDLKTIDLIKKNMANLDDFIFHIHLFLNNEELEKMAYDNIKKIKEQGFKILVTSPKKLPNHFYDIVDIFYHDKENQLLKCNYEDIEVLWHWTKSENMTLYFGVKEVQKHGLAVLRSMIKGCQLAKLNNIKYVIRIEFDDLFGPHSFFKIKSKVEEIIENKFDFLLIRNSYLHYTDISVHLMFYECEKFLNVFGDIINEKTFNDELINLGIPRKSTMLETFIYLMVEFYSKKLNLNVKYNNTEVIQKDYFDTYFNAHQNCFSLTDGILSDVNYVLYNNVLAKKICLAVRNFSSKTDIIVEFIIKYKNSDVESITEINSGGIGCWSLRYLDNPDEIDTILIRNKNNIIHKKYKILKQNDNFTILNMETNEPSYSRVEYIN